MSTAVRLVCPFCRTTVVEGAEPAAGRCPGCDATLDGGAESAPLAVRALLEAIGARDVDADRIARDVFRMDPADPATPITVASDERDGFYRWWVFVRAGVDPRRAIQDIA